ncbi:uncharacterized protein E0L32_002964 [Thyridium curvatum]|uniref:FAD-binding domain-containing protein n=1 Tax=Thyridium curvatum TaxID=1093900 RepID=A0A507BEE8_9PEZI|nr:uncharacterized protein E0L32_002964 [Thyridium curvatum]TPX17863.1 hypothetical protein E0L32_002964 [Thyridium curvatum]
MSEPIRVAIVGGGIAGASLFHALLQRPHLDVHIFESAAEFKEAGAAIGVARNGLAALDLIGSSAAQCLERAGAVAQRGVRAMLAQGEFRNSMIDEARDDDGRRLTSIVHRAAFLRELLAGAPAARMHVSKKLVRVERAGDDAPATLHFVDGTTHECDILVGADGIHSKVRKIILGEDDPAASPRNAGWWAVMALKPYAEARASFDEWLIDADNAREHAWVGDGTYLLHNVLNEGSLVQIVLCAVDEDAKTSEQWHRMASSEEILKLYQDWPPSLNKAVKELLCDQPQQPAMYLWDHPPARTYVSGPLCIMGDAPHPGRVLAANPLRSSRSFEETGVIMTGRGPDGLDLGSLKHKLLQRWDFIIDFDNKKARDEAVEMMRAKLEK